MSNWCDNWLELMHPDPAMVARAHAALHANRFLTEFIPIPAELLQAGPVGLTPTPEQTANLAAFGFHDWCAFVDAHRLGHLQGDLRVPRGVHGRGPPRRARAL
jgi:hypothetical protein